MKKYLSVFVIAALVVMRAMPVFAEDVIDDQTKAALQQNKELIPEKVTLDGKEYTKAELLKAFMEISFSASTPPDHGKLLAHPHWPNEEDKSTLFNPPVFKRLYPWLYEYVYRDKGIPRSLVINKWTKPVHISTGFPNDLNPADYIPEFLFDKAANQSREKMKGTYLTEWSVTTASREARFVGRHAADPTVEKEVVEEIHRAIPELSKITGLDISYVPHISEIKESPADMRIILVDRLYDWKNNYKAGVVLPDRDMLKNAMRSRSGFRLEGVFATGFRKELEPQIKTVVPFTSSSAQQVEGFFLPDAQNGIGMSFCFIWQGHEAEMLKALVKECLVRSLGIPEALHENPDTLLGLWNNQNSEQEKSQKPHNVIQIFTEFDRFMIKLLYHPALKAGMSSDDIYGLMSGEPSGKNISQ